MSRVAAEFSTPSEVQRRALSDMIAAALVEIRAVAGLGRSAQAADLADVFHNIPAAMYGTNWWKAIDFRDDLEGYQRRYANEDECWPRNYVEMFDAAFGDELAEEIKFRQHVRALPSIRTGTMRMPDGRLGLSIRIVRDAPPLPPATAHGNSAPSDPPGAPEAFYGLFGGPDGCQWFISASRFPTLSEAMADFETTFDTNVTWDPPP